LNNKLTQDKENIFEVKDLCSIASLAGSPDYFSDAGWRPRLCLGCNPTTPRLQQGVNCLAFVMMISFNGYLFHSNYKFG
jgi:hypothetical protein